MGESAYMETIMDETLEDILSSNLSRCAAQYVVATYMQAEPQSRSLAVLKGYRRGDRCGRFQ